jgi:hypothetical protein
METIRINSRLTLEERETVLVYSSADKTWYVDTVVPKHMNKFKKQGWKQTAEYVYEDGSPCGGAFEGSERAITIRDPNKKRVMSESQMKNLHRHDDEDDEDEDDDE